MLSDRNEDAFQTSIRRESWNFIQIKETFETRKLRDNAIVAHLVEPFDAIDIQNNTFYITYFNKEQQLKRLDRYNSREV